MIFRFQYAVFLAITLKLRENWRKEAAHLPAPARLMAFTLIELSIVLVVIGLIVGGVLVGQDLIHAAKVRAQISQLQEYETALTTFRLKYNGLAGDLRNPSQFFPGLTSTNATGTLNNKRIDGNTASVGNADLETLDVFWQLGAAELVGGDFDGTFSVKGVPPSKLEDAIRVVPAGQCCGVTQSQLTTAESGLTYRIAFYLTYVNFSSTGQGVLTGISNGITPLTVHTIDEKIDDGIARQGKVKAYSLRGNAPNYCLLVDDGDYDINQTTKSCVLEYIAQK